MPFEECEIATVGHESIRKARKQHICVECRQPILVGERYANMFMLYDGEASDDKQHLCCWSLCRHINHEIVETQDDDQCAFNFGEIKYFFREGEYCGLNMLDANFTQVDYDALALVWNGIKAGDRSYRRELDKGVV